MDLRIDSRNVEMTPRWDSEIRERIEAVQSQHPEMTHARVTLTRSSHHNKGDKVAEVLVVVTMPRRHEIVARKERGSFEEAIRASFGALDVELKKFRDKRASFGPKPSRTIP